MNSDSLLIFILASYMLNVCAVDYHASKKIGKDMDVMTFILGLGSYIAYCSCGVLLLNNFTGNMFTSIAIVSVMGIAAPYVTYIKRLGRIK